MINTVTLVGKVFSAPEIVQSKESEPKWAKFILVVARPYKNRNNDYEIDFITIKTYLNKINEIKEQLQSDTILGINARIQTFNIKNNDFYYTEIIADKITIIA